MQLQKQKLNVLKLKICMFSTLYTLDNVGVPNIPFSDITKAPQDMMNVSNEILMRIFGVFL
jgi:hypothetical protein